MNGRTQIDITAFHKIKNKYTKLKNAQSIEALE